MYLYIYIHIHVHLGILDSRFFIESLSAVPPSLQVHPEHPNGWLLAGWQKTPLPTVIWMVDWPTLPTSSGPTLQDFFCFCFGNDKGSNILPFLECHTTIKKVGCIFPRKKNTSWDFFPHQKTTATLPSLTWNQKMMVSKKESPIPFGAVFRVHVKLWEGIFAMQDKIWLVRTCANHLQALAIFDRTI